MNNKIFSNVLIVAASFVISSCFPSVDKENISMYLGEEISLSPKSNLFWTPKYSCSNEYISYGKPSGGITIKAVKAGTTTLRIEYSNTISYKKRTVPIYIISIKRGDAPVNAIDLGLSVKWADRNVGACDVFDDGLRYAWGEFELKKKGHEDEYRFSNRYSKYHRNDGIPFNLDIEDDASWVNMGFQWRTPTAQEVEELIKNCHWVKENYYGMPGYRITSKVNGNSIFLPAGDYEEVLNSGYYFRASYWTSTGCNLDAFALSFPNDKQVVSTGAPFGGSNRNETKYFRPVMRKI